MRDGAGLAHGIGDAVALGGAVGLRAAVADGAGEDHGQGNAGRHAAGEAHFGSPDAGLVGHPLLQSGDVAHAHRRGHDQLQEGLPLPGEAPQEHLVLLQSHLAVLRRGALGTAHPSAAPGAGIGLADDGGGEVHLRERLPQPGGHVHGEGLQLGLLVVGHGRQKCSHASHGLAQGLVLRRPVGLHAVALHDARLGEDAGGQVDQGDVAIPHAPQHLAHLLQHGHLLPHLPGQEGEGVQDDHLVEGLAVLPQVEPIVLQVALVVEGYAAVEQGQPLVGNGRRRWWLFGSASQDRWQGQHGEPQTSNSKAQRMMPRAWQTARSGAGSGCRQRYMAIRSRKINRRTVFHLAASPASAGSF